MQPRKMMVFLMLAMVLVLGTAVVHALNTPDWWDNPDGYSSHTSYVYEGTMATSNDPNTQFTTIRADGLTCSPENVGSKEVWIQIEWDVTSGIGDLLPEDSRFRWNNQPACPASPNDPLLIPSGLKEYEQGLNDEGAMEFGPEHLTNGDSAEWSVLLSGTDTPFPSTCHRVETTFVLEPNSTIDYRIEVQTVCFSPTAVNLQSFTPAASSLPVASLVGFLGLAIVSFGVVSVRRKGR